MATRSFLGCLIAVLLVFPPAVASAQSTSAGGAGTAPTFEILDNSFLVEEAFNQDRGVVQNIFTWAKDDSGAWIGSFTQEWPAPGVTHQLSYTIPFAGGSDPAHIGGVLLNYRYQLLTEAPGRPAFAPRVSLILPTGDESDSSDHAGLQVNLPFSKQFQSIYVHANAGFTWLRGVPLDDERKTDLTSPQLAGSLVWQTRPMLNLMLESVVVFGETIGDDARTHYATMVTLSPGLRGGWNLGDAQLIIGAAMPVSMNVARGKFAALTYFSYEFPFRKK